MQKGADIDKELTMLDINGVEEVGITINAEGNALWVNIDGLCRLRVYRAKKIVVEGPRGVFLKKKEEGENS